MTTHHHGGLEPIRPALITGARALPLFGAMLTMSTLTHQPDYGSDFSSYAEAITTPRFLASHLLASIVGVGIGAIALVSVAVLVTTRLDDRAVPLLRPQSVQHPPVERRGAVRPQAVQRRHQPAGLANVAAGARVVAYSDAEAAAADF
jgi:hypothetical protein